ncbi:MAG: MFS transporter [Phycisphaeraceae bacterium]|nr:MFS transporter [Phycisphaeraceae bacterium]MCW5762936.1 MFS transporter [Phycisphaeraceae bacterium]
MTTPPTRRYLGFSTADAFLFAIMVGCGEAYFGAFGLAVGMSEIQVGLLASVPLLMGAAIQLMSPTMVRLLDSHKKWVIICTALQSIAFVPMIVMAAMGKGSAFFVFAAAAMYWGANLATGPAWNTWIGTVVPRPIRSRYFASRGRVAQVGIVLGLVATGLLIRQSETERSPAIFLVPFIIAMIARFACMWLHGAIAEPRPIPQTEQRLPIRELVFGKFSASGGRLLLYMLCVQVCVQISGPYFTPFMLGQLEFSYTTFTLILIASFVGKIIALPFLGRIAKVIGERALLWMGGIAIIPLAAVWAVTDHPVALIGLQFAAGFAWACYELATTLMLFESIPAAKRTAMLTLYNFLNAVCVVVGAMIGAAILKTLGSDREAYLMLFIISSIVRVLTLPLLTWIHVPAFVPRLLPLRTLSVRPNAGSAERPVLAADDDAPGPEVEEEEVKSGAS